MNKAKQSLSSMAKENPASLVRTSNLAYLALARAVNGASDPLMGRR